MTFHGVIAIDGPSGSGKSTVSKAVARTLGLRYLDTGAMYRAVTAGALHAGIDLSSEEALVEFVREMELFSPTEPDHQIVLVNGRDVTDEIRTSAISERVSEVASKPGVRRELIFRQQAIVSQGHAIVLEGRDTTTVVAPDADVRVLLTADERARIARRTAELHDEVSEQTLAATASQVVGRDAKDAAVTQFLEAADGVHTLDTSLLSIDESIDAVLALVSASAAAKRGV